MRTVRILALVLVCGAMTATPALAQRVPFERAFDVSGPSTLDVSTIRGKIDIISGDPGRIVVKGTATVRIGWNVPANALELARKVAATPPMTRDDKTIRLRPPSDDAERRAVTVSYEVQVPPDTEVLSQSDSGATTVRDVSGRVVVRTQSAAIELTRLGGTADVTTASGAVTVDGAAGALNVSTSSSAFTGRLLRGALKVRTQSGAVAASLAGGGDVDVKTGSSAISLRGINGGLVASTQSGHVSAEGMPRTAWELSTGSGRMDIAIDPAASFSVDVRSGSGSVQVVGVRVQGSVSKKKVTGAVGEGGPLVRATSRSGSVVLSAASTDSR